MIDQYAVVGNPIAHSKSPQIHKLFAEQTGQRIKYTKNLVAIGDFHNEVSAFFNKGGRGLNVTLPFKQLAFDFASNTTSRAKVAKAVNTLTLNQDGLTLGDNTDGIGLVNDIRFNLGWDLKGKRILVLGAGGAVQGILQALLDLHPQHIVVANRSVDKALDVAKQFSESGYILGCSLDVLDGQEFDVVINGTSASLTGSGLSLPQSIVSSPSSLCYDLMYGSKPTPFMKWAADIGAVTSDGLGMLVEQAAEAFFIWRGVRPETQSVVQKVRSSI